MQLNKKKELAARVLGVGKDRVMFNQERLAEIKEAITRQDIRDLLKDKSIVVKEIKGSRKIIKRKTRRRAGSLKKSVNTRKRDYMSITRKLRTFISELRKKNILENSEYLKLRKEIRAKNFKSKAQMKDRVSVIVKARKESGGSKK
jgi:large subunit ribosomal protein L19e